MSLRTHWKGENLPGEQRPRAGEAAQWLELPALLEATEQQDHRGRRPAESDKVKRALTL